MKSEQINRGRLSVGGAQAVLSHVRISAGGPGCYDEVAYRPVTLEWVVVASYLDGTKAAILFAALDGAVFADTAALDAAAAQALGRSA